MITANRVNINYELELFGPKQSNQNNINKELEYLYFLCGEETPLYTHNKYSTIYLEKLRSIGFKIPEFGQNYQKIKNWWGLLANTDLEKTLNSKLTSVQAAHKLFGLRANQYIVRNNDEIEKIIRSQTFEKWILKDPFLFSGKGFYIFNKNEYQIKVFLGEKILEPYLERVLDLGTLVNGNNLTCYLNLVDESGGYKGSLICKNDFRKYLNFSFNSEDEYEILKMIVNEYKKMGAEDIFSIDSFYYEKDGNIKFYPLVEVNYRKTMGYVAQKIMNNFSHDFLFFFMIPRKKITQEINLNQTFQLSPEDTFFKSFIIVANTISELKILISELKKYFKEEVPYLDNFLINLKN